MNESGPIQVEYFDATGEHRRVSPETLDVVTALVGPPNEDESGPMVLRRGESADLGPGELVLEDGTSVDAGAIDTNRLPLGYHTLVDGAGEERDLIVAPSTCRLPPRQEWGWSAQLYATRSEQSWGIGDFGDLSRIADWSSRHGASFIMVNPLGAPEPQPTQQPSPYFPASRRFLSPLYLDVERVPGSEHCADRIERAAAAGRALNEHRMIDRDRVWELKLEALEAIWDVAIPPEGFEAWYRSDSSLRQFAAWCTLVERHGPDWRAWPADSRRPTEGARQSADPSRARFFAWLQWCARQQLDRVSAVTRIVQDLPIGVDPAGFDAWEWQDLIEFGATVGAPPDFFSPTGQDWGLPPFNPVALQRSGYRPFIETVRSMLARDGGLRIDHVMGLFRLWWIPLGTEAGEGAYVRYPSDDLLAIVALESERANAVIVGEDLGTVQPEVRERLSENGILSYRLLWFEESPPESWPVASLGAVSTHDLPTIAGIWERADAAHQAAMGMEPDEDALAALRAKLASETGLSHDESTENAILAAHRLLARAPSLLLAASLDDAVAVKERPNVPGAEAAGINWRLALPYSIEEIESHPLALGIAAALAEGVTRDRGNELG